MITDLNPKDSYELMENDNGEIMILLYAGESKPINSTCSINEVNNSLEIKRNKEDIVIIDNLQKESITKINSQKTLYICEMKYSENQEQESKILYAYASQLKKKLKRQTKSQ